jgi:DNA-binding transcriptional LysR family regulator
MDLIEALRCFTRIAEVGSFTAVARENGSSASAVNHQIAQLEAHFGIRLFHRTTRRLSLTDDRRELLSHARHLSEMADEITVSMSHQEKSPTGLVRVATPIGTARLPVPRLRSFLESHPGLSVELLISDRNSPLGCTGWSGPSHTQHEHPESSPPS